MNDIRERAANLLNAIDLIKEADAMSGGAIGAGIGGLAGGAGKYLLGDKKKSGLRNFTEGALGGAAVGGAVGAGAGHYAGGKKKIERHDHPTKEELNKEDTRNAGEKGSPDFDPDDDQNRGTAHNYLDKYDKLKAPFKRTSDSTKELDGLMNESLRKKGSYRSQL